MVERRDEDVILMRANHDGYRGDFGVIHERRMAIKRDGLRVDGEDDFTFAPAAKGSSNPAYAVRFHLHPQITASRTRDSGRVLLTPARGDSWEFYAGGADISIEESVYLGGIDGPRRTDQIVLHGRCRHSPRVNWRLRKLVREEQSAAPAEEAGEPPLASEVDDIPGSDDGTA
jgi:uncharacterized heparinase superfamily protein